MPEHLFSHPSIRIRVLTKREHLAPARETAAASNRKCHDDSVAFAQVSDLTAGLDDFTHEFVTQDVTGFHCGDEAVIQMQIGAADGSRCDSNDRVFLIQYLGIWHLLDPDVPEAIPNSCSH